MLVSLDCYNEDTKKVWSVSVSLPPTVGLAAVLGFEKRPARNRSCHEKLLMKIRTKAEQ
jgi:hypothetical protein